MKRIFTPFVRALRRAVLSPAERELLGRADAAQHLAAQIAVGEVRLRWLAATEANGRALLAGLSAPHRWMPDEPITREEALAWEAFILSPLGRKLDLAMIQWAQQQAQDAVARPGEQLAHSAGFARGCMAGWQMAKTLSRLAQDAMSPEPDDATARAGLAQHQP